MTHQGERAHRMDRESARGCRYPVRGDPGPIGPAAADGPRAFVLVVDDDPVKLMVAAEMIAVCGFEPLLAGDGAEAVAMACELRVQLILMDLQMPVLDGLSATVQIRHFEQQHAVPRVPVVAYTSSEMRHNRLLLRDIGFDAVLEKPGDMASFQACLARWCPAWTAPGLGRVGHTRAGHIGVPG